MKKSAVLLSIFFVFSITLSVFSANTKVAVILSGCGVYDGSEIQEATLTLLCLDQNGASVECFAPDKPQTDVIDHITGSPVDETRNVLTEAARINRGKVKPLSDLKVKDFDAIMLPGGLGAGKNLCNFMSKGAMCTVDPTLEAVLKKAHADKKPIGFICLAPIIAAKLFGPENVKITLGKNKDLTLAAQSMQATTVPCTATQICSDDANKIYSTPAYIEAKGIAELYEGIKAVVIKVLENVKTKKES